MYEYSGVDMRKKLTFLAVILSVGLTGLVESTQLSPDFACLRAAMCIRKSISLNGTKIDLPCFMEDRGHQDTLDCVKRYCPKAREYDWRTYCTIMYSEGWQIDCDNANVAAKEEILNQIVFARSSAQYACVIGGKI